MFQDLDRYRLGLRPSLGSTAPGRDRSEAIQSSFRHIAPNVDWTGYDCGSEPVDSVRTAVSVALCPLGRRNVGSTFIAL